MNILFKIRLWVKKNKNEGVQGGGNRAKSLKVPLFGFFPPTAGRKNDRYTKYIPPSNAQNRKIELKKPIPPCVYPRKICFHNLAYPYIDHLAKKNECIKMKIFKLSFPFRKPLLLAPQGQLTDEVL